MEILFAVFIAKNKENIVSLSVQEQIRLYVQTYAEPLPETQMKRAIDSTDKKIRDLTRHYIKGAKNEVQATKKRLFCTQFNFEQRLHIMPTAIQILKTTFKADYDVDFIATVEGDQRAASFYTRREDSLIGGLSKSPAALQAIKVTLKFYDDNPHIYGLPLEVAALYTPQAHLKRELEAARKGRGTDLIIREKGATNEASILKAHKAKLLMHSETFFKERCSNFKESAENSNLLELDPKICTLKTFEYLLEFIYLGEVSQDHKIDLQQLLKICSAADYFFIDGINLWAITRLHTLVGEKKMSVEELCPFFNQALTTSNEGMIAFCFGHFSMSELIHDTLVSCTTKENWERLYVLAKSYPDVRQILEQMTKTNRDLLQFNPKRKKAEALAPAAASNSSSSNSSSSSSSSSSTQARSLDAADDNL